MKEILLTLILLGVAYFSVRDLYLDQKLGRKCYGCGIRKKEIVGLHMEQCTECLIKDRQYEKARLLRILQS